MKIKTKLHVTLVTGAVLAAACGSSSKTTTATTVASSATSAAAGAAAGPAPAAITVGTLYAGTGSFAVSSLPEYEGIKFWVHEVDASGGAYVKAYNKKIPIKLVSYNDQSSTSTAGTLYTQLITQNHVNILMSDFGSVLTAPAVTIAKENKQLLFDVSGTGTTFFQASNNDPYIVLTSLPVSSIWPQPAVAFMKSVGIKNVAIIYGANDFDQAQANTYKQGLAAEGINVSFFQSVPTATTSYTTLIQEVAAKKPDAFLELGYEANDIAFLKQLHSSGTKFPYVFTVFPEQNHSQVEAAVGASGLAYTYTYGAPPALVHNSPSVGLGLSSFTTAFESYASKTHINFEDIAGYNAGLVVQQALANAASLSQTDLRAGVLSQSGKFSTLIGPFSMNAQGAQTGFPLPVAQLLPASSGSATKVTIVWPKSKATGTAVYPAP